MKLEGSDYIMTSAGSEAADSFDLQLLKHINSKTNPRDEFVDEGYGMCLDSCIKRICRNRVAKNLNGNSTTLEKYVASMKAEYAALREQLNGVI